MSDGPSLEPPRGLPPLGTNALIGVLAFLGGIGTTLLIVQLSGSTPPKAPQTPAAASTPQPQPNAPAPGTDIASLFARELALAARLEQLEGRLGEADSGARTAAAHATQAERLMIAFAVRRAIERGLPLESLERPLRQRFGEQHREAVAAIVQATGRPVTLEDLRVGLDVIGPRLASAPTDGLWSLYRRGRSDLVVLRQADSPSPRAADRLKRARRLLDEGQVEAARAEVIRMPGVALAQNWLTEAGRYIGARAALREIEAAAMETPPPPAQPRAGA
jgi:hypothetical protein